VPGGDSPEGEYERHRGLVLGVLAKRFPRFDADERLSIYHDAWARVYTKRARGEEIESLRAYLVATACAEAMHAVSRGKPPSPVGPDDLRLTTLADEGMPVDEQVLMRDQVRLARELLDSLDDERQRQVLKLRWDLQLRPAEIRAALDLSPRQYQRLAEEGAAAVAKRVTELEDGSWSRRQRSLLTACLVEVTCDGEERVGIASERQREEAQRLLETDPHVAALYAEVRGALRRAAALLPLPVLVADPAWASPGGRLAELAAEARSQLVGLMETGKQNALSLYIRGSDPTLFASARPGTVVAALAGSLAIGGGAYGAYAEIATRAPSTVAAATASPTSPRNGPAPRRIASPRKGREAKRHKSPVAPVIANPVPTQPQTTPPTQIPTPPNPTPIPSPSPPTPAGDGEFGFED
jgi:DNA-directed RNA polymerase specialized sigma24 family protein